MGGALLSRGDIAEARRWADEAAQVGPKHAGSPLAVIAVDAWAGNWTRGADAFPGWVRDLPKASDSFPWSNRRRIAALLLKAREAEQLNSFAAALRSAARRPCWHPWAEAVEALLAGRDPSTLANLKSAELHRLLTKTV